MANLTVQDDQVGYPFPLGVECPPLRVWLSSRHSLHSAIGIAPSCRVRPPKVLFYPLCVLPSLLRLSQAVDAGDRGPYSTQLQLVKVLALNCLVFKTNHRFRRCGAGWECIQQNRGEWAPFARIRRRETVSLADPHSA